jgi:hypothetical protein
MLGWLKKLKNVYESARRNTSKSILRTSLNDARVDYSSWTRENLTKLARFWAVESPLVTRAISIFRQYVVGPRGMQFIPESDDEFFNESVSQWFAEEFSVEPDLFTSQSFASLQGLIVETWIVDGEVFILLTVDRFGRPKIQLIDSHRIKTPPTMRDREGVDVIDGIAVANGVPIGYWVCDAGRDPQFVERKDMIHHFSQRRPGQYRGVTRLCPVLNEVHDQSDLQLLEMRAAKQNAEIANVIKRKGGEHRSQSIESLMGVQTIKTSTGTDGTRTITRNFENALPGNTIVLDTDEDASQFKTDRPSVVTQQYWDLLSSYVCAGLGVSKLLILPYSMQGTVVRADLDITDTTMKALSAELEPVMVRIYKHSLKHGLPPEFGRPNRWDKVSVNPPRSVTVDIGYNSAAAIAELKVGVKNYRELYGMLGKDWRQEIKELAKEKAFIKSLEEEFGVTILLEEKQIQQAEGVKNVV